MRGPMSSLKDYLVKVEPVDAGDPLYSFARDLTDCGAIPVMEEGTQGVFAGPTGAGKRLLGLIHADQVADHEYPQGTKARRMVLPTRQTPLDTRVEEVVAHLVEAQVRAVPVVSGDRYLGLVTERSLLKLPEITNDTRGVDRIASRPVTIGEDETLGHARAMMRRERIGRLPVVGPSGELMGLVEWMDPIRVDARVDDPRRLIAQDRVPVSRLQVTTAMDPKPLTVGTKDTVGDVARRMMKMNRSCAVLLDDKRPVGIVTCEDLLEPIAARFAETTEGLYVQVAGLNGVDPFDRRTVDRLIQENLQRFIHAVKDPEYLVVHVKSYEETGSRKKWSVRARMADAKGTINARRYGYDLPEVVDGVLERLGRIALEQRERGLDIQHTGGWRAAHNAGF